MDGETDNYYLRDRYYGYSSGRFTQMDRWQGRAGDAITLNKYVYGNSNSTRYTDPSGQMSIGTVVTIAAMGAVLVGVEGHHTLNPNNPRYRYGNKPIPTFRMTLNSESTTKFSGMGFSFDVFSGNVSHRNNPDSESLEDQGPLPRGRYYIVDRLSPWWVLPLDIADGRAQWFSLYRDDGYIDDFTTINGTTRSLFRMHAGTLSAGCVTFKRQSDFNTIRNALRYSGNGTTKKPKLKYYGILEVR